MIRTSAIIALAFCGLASAHDGQALDRQAALSMQEAASLALKTRSGTVTKGELEREEGGSGLRYSFDISADGQDYEVAIDAVDGKVLENTSQADHEAEDGGEPDKPDEKGER